MMIVIIVIHLMMVLGMIGVVLLQKSEGGGLVSTSDIRLYDRPWHRQRFHADDGSSCHRLFSSPASLCPGLPVSADIPASIINTGGGAPASQQAPAGPPSSMAPLGQTGRGILEQLGGNPH